MAIAAQVKQFFSEKIRERGEAYFHEGDVQFSDDCSDDAIHATVFGSDDYDVRIQLHKKGNATGLRVGCTCPYFQTNDLCKHLWAVLLATDAQGRLSSAHGVTLNFIEEESSGDPGDDDDDLPVIDLEHVGDFIGREAKYKIQLKDGSYATIFSPGLVSKLSRGRGKSAPPIVPTWKDHLQGVQRGIRRTVGYDSEIAAIEHQEQLVYVIDLDELTNDSQMMLSVYRRPRTLNGEWGRLKLVRVRDLKTSTLADTRDKQIISILQGADLSRDVNHYGYLGSYHRGGNQFPLAEATQWILFPLLAATGRFFAKSKRHQEELYPLGFDDVGAWRFQLRVDANDTAQQWIVRGVMIRDTDAVGLDEFELIHPSGILLRHRVISKYEDAGVYPWIAMLRTQTQLEVPYSEGNALVDAVYNSLAIPSVIWPSALQFDEVKEKPQAFARVTMSRRTSGKNDALTVRPQFRYFDEELDVNRAAIVKADERKIVYRDRQEEGRLLQRLVDLGCRFPQHAYALNEANYGSVMELSLTPKRLPALVRALTREGWHVEAHGKYYRQAHKFEMNVSTGIDWFDLTAKVEFNGELVAVPELLRALKRGDDVVQLDDGSLGLLPEAWLKKYGVILHAGDIEGDRIRFGTNQAILLDLLLAEQEQAHWDAGFERWRNELRRFEGIREQEQPATFRGTLRDYQKEGLGWLEFLRMFRVGGCLADDMGLGKTIQVLAMLAHVYDESVSGTQPLPPSLIVVPKSVIHNWASEAARFVPHLKVVAHVGVPRATTAEALNPYRIVLTTYGTLRQDLMLFKSCEFHYLILDESQAIKNAESQSAKAARLIPSRYRLALSGTPVENHIDELWSLFEFLNPGMLGHAFANSKSHDAESVKVLARAVKPFILRRTKQQVAQELPEKTEQVLYCELDRKQRKLYNEIRDHYRESLLDHVDAKGLASSKIQVLEALLRLRQAACHPGLLDASRKAEESAKLETLLEQLVDIRESGHKALIFSQFTSLLAIVRQALDKENVVYEYLDGKTRQREEKVRRFQEDRDCTLFLISLKAGGVGLNLTAAEYVFLLDPWWNPAVEAQAIDRAHRIGQTRHVFAYRLIAKDTVEEKILDLQQKKRDLVEAIMGEGTSVIRDLTREDLEMLLS